MRVLFSVCLLSTAGIGLAQDPYCPRYPVSVRTEMEESLALDREFQAHARSARAAGLKRTTPTRLAASANFIDQLISKKMSADGVTPATGATDAEFLRRASLDLTGRIPSPEQAEAFLSDSSAGKRDALIDRLLASPAYADQFTLFLANRSRSRARMRASPRRRATCSTIRPPGRGHRTGPMTSSCASCSPSAGEVDTSPGTQFFARWMDIAGPIQDSWDDITEKITTSFLGYKTECVSCHNGRAHLEKINLHLSRRHATRFLADVGVSLAHAFVRFSDDPIGFRPRIIVADRTTALTRARCRRPTPATGRRASAPWSSRISSPAGQQPASGDWRQELARMITTDRQFARATAKLPLELFLRLRHRRSARRVGPGPRRSGPPAARRLADAEFASRIAREALRTHLIANGYRFEAAHPADRYQRHLPAFEPYEGQWKPAYVKYFARHEARRLSAEQMYDSMITATHTEQPMALASAPWVVRYANQLPDPTEPFTDSRVVDFLNQLGRGNWLHHRPHLRRRRCSGLLYQMNDPQNVNRSLGLSNGQRRRHQPGAQIDADYPDDMQAIRRMFLATLTRYPTDREMALVLQRRSGPRYQWLSDLQWALLNKLDFAFNY